MKTWIGLLAAVVMGAGAVLAQAVANPGAPAQCHEAITLFQDVSPLGRKDRAAQNMTDRHRDMGAQGWRYADTEAYTENGDLEGFFVTYTRTVDCP